MTLSIHRSFPARASSRFFPVLALIALLVVGCGSQPQVRKAPDFQVTGIDGKEISLSALKGKVVFLEFWATWCPPCVMSIPEVIRLDEDYSKRGLTTVSLSLDQNEEVVLEFMKRYGMTSQVAVIGNSGVADRYRVSGIPAFFIIDKDGNIAGAWRGYSPSMSASWRKELDRHLKV